MDLPFAHEDHARTTPQSFAHLLLRNGWTLLL
jgi:hypothetical protein